MKKLFLVSLLLISSFSHSQTVLKKKNKIQEQKEEEVVDYSNISKILKKDGLIQHKIEKKKKLEKIIETKKKINQHKYNIPGQEDFWSFMSEMWLVKNAQNLQWDFSKPEYGIGAAFKNLLQKIGYYNKKIRILVINSPELTHAALPGNKDEYFFVISLPFMRTMDLTKVDISLLFLEDMFRVEEGFFIKNIKADTSFIGTNFSGKKFDLNKIKNILKDYSRILYEDGFTFQQQYTVTKKMDHLLKSDPGVWSTYLKLIHKIDRLVKSNLLYKDYTKIYPSPELQLKWLVPEQKRI